MATDAFGMPIVDSFNSAYKKRKAYTPEKIANDRASSSMNEAKNTMAGGTLGGFDSSIAQGSYDKQNQFADMLYGSLVNNVPSVAENQYKQGLASLQNSRVGMLSGLRGSGSQLASAARANSRQLVDESQAANRDIGILKAEEQANNEKMYASLADSMRRQSSAQEQLKNQVVAEAFARAAYADKQRIGLDTSTKLTDIQAQVNSEKRKGDLYNSIIGSAAAAGAAGLSSWTKKKNDTNEVKKP